MHPAPACNEKLAARAQLPLMASVAARTVCEVNVWHACFKGSSNSRDLCASNARSRAARCSKNGAASAACECRERAIRDKSLAPGRALGFVRIKRLRRDVVDVGLSRAAPGPSGANYQGQVSAWDFQSPHFQIRPRKSGRYSPRDHSRTISRYRVPGLASAARRNLRHQDCWVHQSSSW